MTASRVKTSDMTLTILEKIAFSDEPLTQVQVARAVGIVKSAAHKHLFTLEDSGWISRDPGSGHYRLTPKAWLVGQRAPHIGDLVASAEALMRAARQETGLAVVLSLVAARSLDVIAALSGTHAIEIGVRQGSSLALHASAQGQVMLAFGEPDLARAVLAGDLAPLTPRSIVDANVLRDRLESTVRRGYCVAPEETLPGVNAIAAPVFDHAERLVGTVALVGSIQHLTDPVSGAHVAIIERLARDVSRIRGYGPK